MSWYKAGSVTSVAGTNVITGTGTLWSNPIFGIAPGQMIFVPGAGQVVIYEILAIDSDTQIRTSSNSASSITDSDYAIVTTVSNSMSDLARRTAVQLALYQKLLEDWQQITTGTGLITLVAPDGTEVTISALGDLTADVEWLQENKDQIVNAAGYAEEAKQYRDDALASATSASGSEDSAAVSASQAINAVNSIGTSVQDAQTAANTATDKAAQASSDADRAEAAADTVDTEALLNAIDSKMAKSGGSFTGPIALSGDATTALNPVTKQQLDFHNKSTYLYPGGTEASPASISANQRIVVVNPFAGRAIHCIAEVKWEGNWGASRWWYNPTSNDARGTNADVLTLPNGVQSIIIQSGSGTPFHRNASYTGSPLTNTATGDPSSVPFRVKVWTVD